MGGGWFDNINHMNTLTIFNLMPPKSGSDLYQTFTNTAQTIPVVGADGSPTTSRRGSTGRLQRHPVE